MIGLARKPSETEQRRGRLTKFLTGAPRVESLDWGEASLTAGLSPAFQSASHPKPDTRTTPLPNGLSQSDNAPLWRTLHDHDLSPSRRVPDESAFSEEGPDFHQTDLDSRHVDFLNHSLAILTQLEANDDETGLELTSFITDFGDGYESGTFTTCSFTYQGTPDHQSNIQIQQIRIPLKISDLKSLPSANHIHRIQPQTITVNLIVGVVSISPLRRIRVRSSRRELDIVEVLLGDDTKAAFTLTLWLPPTEHEQSKLRITADRLRVQDVVLIRDVALSTWKGRVYGQSLNRRYPRVETTIDVLSRGTERVNLPHPAEQKLSSVVEWVERFVGRATSDTRGHCNNATVADGRLETVHGGIDIESLPADTQPS